jgi:hypothetical protein
VKAAGEESDQLDFLYWGDVHFLISATHQLSEALDGLPGGPKLPKRLNDRIHRVRHAAEHWRDDDERNGSWRTLIRKHAPGADLLSLDELEEVLNRVRDELLEVYPAKLKLLEVYHGMPQQVEADATGRAVAHAWQEMLELHDGQWELIDREQFRARVRELLELNCENPRTVPDLGSRNPMYPAEQRSCSLAVPGPPWGHQLRQAGITMRPGGPPLIPSPRSRSRSFETKG